MRKFRFFSLMGSWYILPARLEDNALLESNLSAGVDKVHRDIILGHSLHGTDVHYMSPSEEDLHRAMARYTEW